MSQIDTLAEDVTSSEESLDSSTVSTDHWMRRVSIVTLMAGVGVTVGGFNISELDETLGHQISLVGIVTAATGAVAWFVTRLILKGSRNV